MLIILGTTTALTAVENKIPRIISNLAKKIDYNIKVIETELNLIIVIMIKILQLQSLIL